jgi:hypothetical protein
LTAESCEPSRSIRGSSTHQSIGDRAYATVCGPPRCATCNGSRSSSPSGRLHVHRVKNGMPSVHPIHGDEMRALRKLRRDYPTDAHVSVSERGGPISPIGFHRLIQRLGEPPRCHSRSTRTCCAMPAASTPGKVLPSRAFGHLQWVVRATSANGTYTKSVAVGAALFQNRTAR